MSRYRFTSGAVMLFGKDVERQHALMFQIGQDLAAPIQNLCCRGGSEQIMSDQPLRLGRIKQLVIAQQHTQRQMASHLGAQIALDLKTIHFINQVADQHDQSAFAKMRGQMQKGQVVARLDQLRKAVERGMQQVIHLAHPAPRGHEIMDSVREADQSHRITLPQRHVAEHQRGIERMVEQAEAAGRVVHHAATVQQKHNPLALAGLIFFDGQPIPPRRRSPVNMLVVVIHRVITQPFKIMILPDLPAAAHPHQTQPIGAGQHRIFRQLDHVGVNVHHRFDRTRVLTFP